MLLRHEKITKREEQNKNTIKQWTNKIKWSLSFEMCLHLSLSLSQNLHSFQTYIEFYSFIFHSLNHFSTRDLSSFSQTCLGILDDTFKSEYFACIFGEIKWAFSIHIRSWQWIVNSFALMWHKSGESNV